MESPVIIPQNLSPWNREHAEAIRVVRYQADEIFHDVVDDIKEKLPSRIPQGASLRQRRDVYRILAEEGFEKWKNLVFERFKDNASVREILLVKTEKYYWFRFLKKETFEAPLEEVFLKAYPPVSAPDIANLNQKV